MKYRLTIFLLLCIAHTSYGQLLINEFSAANKEHLTDNYGETPDWIEIYNSGATDIDLTGYYMSDNLANPTKWEVPGGIVPAGGFLIVYATGRDEFFGGFLHAGFKITQTQGEDIVLTGPGQAVIDFPSSAQNAAGDQRKCAIGSSGFTPRRISKCNCGLSTVPVEPARAMTWPRST